MNEQYARYEVPIWEAGWALSGLRNAGIPVVTTAQQGHILVIVIPAQYAEFDHHAAPPRKRRWLRLSPRLLIWLAVAVVGAVGLWVFLNGGVSLPSVALPSAPPVAPKLPDVGGLQGAVDGALNAVKVLTFTVVGMGAMFVAYKFRGPLASMAGALGNVVKGLRRER